MFVMLVQCNQTTADALNCNVVLSLQCGECLENFWVECVANPLDV